MYPSHNPAPNQPGFAGAPNSQQVYQNFQQQHGFQNPYGYQNPVVSQPGYGQGQISLPYPQWFGQVTNVDPLAADGVLRTNIQTLLLQYQSVLGNAFPLIHLTQPNAEFQPQYQSIITNARHGLILLLLKNFQVDFNTNVLIAAKTAVIGHMVDAIQGGIHSPQIPALSQVLRTDVGAIYQNYQNAVQGANNAIHEVQLKLNSQNAMNGYGVAPNQMGNGQINNGYASQRVAASALTSMGTMTSGFLNPTIPKQHTPFDGVGEVTEVTNDVYSLALAGKVGRLTKANETVDNTPFQNTNQSNDPGNCIMNAFALQSFAFTGSNAAEEQTVPTAAPVNGGITLADDSTDVGEITRSVLPRRGTTEVTTAVPEHGLPSRGHYNFGKDNFDVKDYNTPATLQEHLDNTPPPDSRFSDELGDEESFLNQDQFDRDAFEQTMMESVSPKPDYNSLDDMLSDARDQGYEVREPRLVVPYSTLSEQERTGLVRRLRIRVVPAYFRSKTGLIQIAEGARREIIIEKWDESVDYNSHETEIEQSKSFASWDKQALDISAARSVMSAAAKQDTWSEDFFIRKLNERIEEDPTEDIDNILSELIADRQIIDMDEPVTIKAGADDGQSAIIDELASRGVDRPGTLLENSIIRYTRFETNNFLASFENREMIDQIRLVKTAAEIVPALDKFKAQSTIPIREVARILSKFTTQVNRYLATEFSNGWSITNPIADFKELYDALIEAYDGTIGENQVIATLNAIYVSAAEYAFRLIDVTAPGSEETEIAVGTLSSVILVPFYYSQYPIDFLDTAGAVLKENHPELYEFLNVASDNGNGQEINLITLDNVVLTFTRSLGEDRLFFMVAKS